MPPTLKNESHPPQEPGLRPVWVVGMEGETIVVLKVGPKCGAVLELFVKKLPGGVRGDARLQAGCVLDPPIAETLHVVVSAQPKLSQIDE
eukprot:570878-Alexandrium_andersonii.AAC.1